MRIYSPSHNELDCSITYTTNARSAHYLVQKAVQHILHREWALKGILSQALLRQDLTTSAASSEKLPFWELLVQELVDVPGLIVPLAFVDQNRHLQVSPCMSLRKHDVAHLHTSRQRAASTSLQGSPVLRHGDNLQGATLQTQCGTLSAGLISSLSEYLQGIDV